MCVCDQVSALALTTIAMVDHGPRVNLGVQGALNYELYSVHNADDLSTKIFKAADKILY